MDMDNTQAKEQFNQQIRLEETRLLYAGTAFSCAASAIIALTIYFILTGHVITENNLGIWLFTILSVLLIRSIDSYRFSVLNKQAQLDSRWRTRFFIGTGITGFCWGLLAWLGYSNNVEHIAFIIICELFVIVSSFSTLSCRWDAMVIFLVPCSLLPALKLIIDKQDFSYTIFLVFFVFIFFSLLASKRIFNSTQQKIRLRIEADNREQAIELMHQKQALHLQNTPLAIIEFDIYLNITEWNKAAEKIFGYTRDEALGENIIRLILPRDSSDEAEKLWQRLLNHEAVTGAAIENKTKSGSPIYCEWFVTPLTDNKNNIICIASMALDITDKKYNELAIIKSKEEAEKASQAKSDFLSSMSHELRTPLNAILGFTQLLTYEKMLTDKQQSHVSEIRSAGNLLLELVNQILDLASIEKGHLQPSMEQVKLLNIFRECRSIVSPLANQNNISLDVITDTSAYVIADYTRLKQVVLNLLSNAIKYNVEGGSVCLKFLQKENTVMRICIIDTGKGISEELLQKIFQPFNRLDAACNIEGTGIGLSISKQLVEMMNGKIGVTSKINEGSNFWIELPGGFDASTTIDHQDKPGLPNASLIPSVSSNLNILVAEDNSTNQTLILNQLKALGYTAELAINGHQALNRMLDKNYDLLLTDCNMPLVDGYRLARTIRQKGNNNLPIIALTADAFPETKSKCIKAGMNDQMTKPIDLATLKNMLEKYLTE